MTTTNETNTELPTCDECGREKPGVRHVETALHNCNACLSCVPADRLLQGRCEGGCSLWDCNRPAGHAGPCQP